MSGILVVPAVLLIISAVFAFIGSIGIIRMPDVYNRIHSETLIVVGGSILGFIGVALFGIVSSELANYAFSLKALIIAIFLLITNPVGSHAIARAAHKAREKPFPGTRVDKLEEAEE
ncbi:hypothetical protein AKJ62_04310 [candidate division MSBL1 archaeon SCGC-AAA259D14]|uniref:Cation:proton antiporter n=1 Tax=candidate division MSBL1 archaeon SCGC-AAA259D14 TaxID=1698261 RepID=A0A133U3U1_9EURY|nr:hypothetical protein AKJ62_04310 [candidate division MSBL1 archaeon SCGC-AAA259D14]